MKGTKVTGINYTEVEAIVVMSYINFRNLNAVAFHPMDFVIGPKIYISTARTIINLYLGTLTYFLLSINRICWVPDYWPNLISHCICSFRCGVPSSCCKESYRMESGLIKIRCGFEVQDRKKFTEAVVKEKVILLNKDTLNLASLSEI